jgi:hypothetical protein
MTACFQSRAWRRFLDSISGIVRNAQASPCDLQRKVEEAGRPATDWRASNLGFALQAGSYSAIVSKLAFPPAAVVLMVMVRSVAKRSR